jgi:uncharacterized protein YgbK (DUF1537 family)
MPQPPFIVIADDLTGAAELAATAHHHGLSATVLTRGLAPTSPADVWVYDTDSRLDSPDIAAAKIARLIPTLRALNPALIYKKTDSVLRGPVRAELEALANPLGLARALLVPANPRLGRTVQAGRYSVNGVPLHQTAFRKDPHHPATTDDACALLGSIGTLPVHSRSAKQLLPARGIVIGDASDEADLDTWATFSRESSTLLAGASEFFAALLRQCGCIPAANRPDAARPPGPTLILSGTTHPDAEVFRRTCCQAVARPAEHPIDIAAWAGELRLRLVQQGLALAYFDGPRSTDPRLPPALRATLAGVATQLIADRAFTHLIVEGGSTAAAITQALDWSELRLHHAWSSGVASLRPISAPLFTLTLKPGSYPWPAALASLSA